MMNNKRRLMTYLTITVLIIGAVFIWLIEPFVKTVDELIITDLDYNVDQDVYLIMDKISVDNADLDLRFITYMPEMNELQFGLKMKNYNKPEYQPFDYKFKLLDGDEIITDSFVVTHESKFMYSHYRVAMPVDISLISELKLDILDSEGVHLATVDLSNDVQYARLIEYDFSSGEFKVVE